VTLYTILDLHHDNQTKEFNEPWQHICKKNGFLVAPVLGKTGQEGYFNQLEKNLTYGHTGLDLILAEKKIGTPAPCSQSAETRKTSG
jgi:hypothetical protein